MTYKYDWKTGIAAHISIIESANKDTLTLFNTRYLNRDFLLSNATALVLCDLTYFAVCHCLFGSGIAFSTFSVTYGYYLRA